MRQNLLPLDAQLETAVQHIIRARIFYDLWRYYEGRETRPTILDTMNLYPGFFPFDSHAHFVSFIVHIVALFDGRSDTINLAGLMKRLRAAGLISAPDAQGVNDLLKRANPLANKAKELRHNLFAHRSAHLSYAAAFRQAAVTPNQLLDLTNFALKAVNRLFNACGRGRREFNLAPLRHLQAMIQTLSNRADGSGVHILDKASGVINETN